MEPNPWSQALTRLNRALDRHALAVGAGWGLAVALALGVLLAGAARLMPLWTATTLLRSIAPGAALGTLAGALWGWLRVRPTPRRMRLLDRRLRLANRLTTAWELEQKRITAPAALSAAQQQETLHTLRLTEPRAAFPPYPQRKAVWSCAALLALLAIAFALPNPQETILAQREALRQATAAEVQRLEETLNLLETNPALDPEARAAALQALEEALATLEDPQATLDEQQLALAEAERQLAALRSAESEARLEHLAEAAPLSTEEVVRPLAEALERGDLQAAADYLQSLTDPNGEPLTAAETQALADALAEMADTLQTTEPELAAQLNQLAQEVYSGDSQAAQHALQETAQTLTELSQTGEASQSLQEAQAQLQEAQAALGRAQGQNPSGMPQSGPQSGAGNVTGNPSGQAQHSEDSGSGAPFGEQHASRIEETNGLITLPREQVTGAPQETLGAAGAPQVPYRAVYADYAQAAEAELSRRALPPGLRTYVRDYFSELEP